MTIHDNRYYHDKCQVADKMLDKLLWQACTTLTWNGINDKLEDRHVLLYCMHVCMHVYMHVYGSGSKNKIFCSLQYFIDMCFIVQFI